ncbi:MAG: arabinose ABC transporter permease [Sphingopyxis macrogoltabida]|uniref:Arabinose ABC transporter permease n=1 Tax=Sphingopyxis macrogoltabida TaxID=33050 RepID=A0A2W5L7W2_SPHMC|nr:MAG: arabinose ABC transporter permease [Sphingopyxis macrogoltabida]
MSSRSSAFARSMAPLSVPVFRAIWIANLASIIGGMVQSVGAAWLMTELTSSNQLIALVQACAMMPLLFFGVFAGAIADNYDRRLVMLTAQGGMLVVSAILTFVTGRGSISPTLLLVLTFGIGAGTALNAPAWQASVRAQVEPQHLPYAIALNTLAFQMGRSVGPALGGLVISLGGPQWAFAFNSVSYLALIIVLSRWKPVFERRERTPMFRAIGTGLRFCGQSRPVRRILLRACVVGLGAASYQALLPAIIRDIVGGDELDYGFCLAAFGVCSIFVAVSVQGLREKYGAENVIGTAALIMAAALAMAPFASVIWFQLVVASAAGGAWVAMLSTLNMAMQLRAPDAILGRCLAIYQATAFGALAGGAYLAGLIADLSSLEAAATGASIWLLLSFLMRFLAPMPARDEGRVVP